MGDNQIQFADAGLEGEGVEAVGMPCAFVVPLVGRGVEVVISLSEHGLVDDETQGGIEAVEAAFQDDVEDFRIEGWIGGVRSWDCVCFCSKPHQTTCDRTLTTPDFLGDP